MDSSNDTTANSRSLALVEAWAQLANVSGIDDLSLAEQVGILELLELACRAYAQSTKLDLSARSQRQLRSLTPSSKNGRAVLRKAHKLVHDVMVALLDGKTVQADVLGIREVSTVWQLTGPEGTLAERFAVRDGHDMLSFLLFLTLKTAGPFPLRRCRQCTCIFVRHRRQEFCSSRCRTKSAESRRKLTPARRAQLAKAAKAHRAKKKVRGKS